MARSIGLFVVACCLAAPAQALVGPASEDGSHAANVVMVLKRSAHGAAFCTGVVVARDAVLTAGHCATRPQDLRILPGAGGDALLEVSQVAVHPGYRPNAPKTRERSIDLALLRMAAPLPSALRPTQIDFAPRIDVGLPFRIAGFGLGREGDERSAGKLREGTLVARAPLSSILLWATDPQKRGFGACTGDSGGPIFSDDGQRLVAITVWSTGEGRKACGAVTQGALLAPQRGWIESVLRSWSR